SFNQFAIIFGMLVVYFVNWGIAKGQTVDWINSVGWRYMFGSEAIPALLFGLLLLMVPESPRYLALRKREDTALVVLTKVNGTMQRAGEIMDDIKRSLGSQTKV